MDPDFGHYARMICDTQDIPRNIPMKLTDMVRYLLPNTTEMLQKHHSADTDALMHWMVCREHTRMSTYTT